VLNVKRLRKLNLVFVGILLVVFGFGAHSFLAEILEVFPNKGISFGWSSNFLVGIAFLFLVLVWLLLARRGDIGLMLIAGGGVINFIDRIVFGYVRDYWSLGIVYNNLADWIICFGVGYSFFKLWQEK
jgi:lipoprotein signal peptidase